MTTVRLVLISDTHEQHEKLGRLPDGDVLVHAGDLTYRGDKEAVHSFLQWFVAQPHPHKIFIAGNHDFGMRTTPLSTDGSIHYLVDSGVELCGLKFWGSPYTPRFRDWAFMYDRPTERWEAIPYRTDVLITHGPPMGVLDRPFGNQPGVGCWNLARWVRKRRPRLHVFGHIHGSAGRVDLNGTTFVNASVVNEAYEVVNRPEVVGLEVAGSGETALHLGHHIGPVHPDVLPVELPKRSAEEKEDGQ